MKRRVAWLSLSRGPRRVCVLGVGIGRSKEDRTLCVIVQLFVLTIVVGLHYLPERVIVAAYVRKYT